MQSLARLLLAFACLLLGPLAVIAKESPADTNKIKSLSPEQARKLVANLKGKGQRLDLNGLTKLDADTAKALAEFKGSVLSLNGLTTLDADTAKALANFKTGQRLDLNGLTKLDADTAKALAEFKGQGLSLNGLTALDADTAKALAELKGQVLSLNGLTTLDADTAKALAQYKGRDLYLYLNGLTTLSPEAATALAGFKDSLGLGPGVAELQTIALDNAGIVMLADRQQPQYLSFPHVTALDSPDAVAIAEILASVKAPVLLPNLKRLSAKTFETLTKKEDLLLAELDTLEFIPEPDGSGNASDDIVLPDGFEKRQRVLRKLFNVK